MFTQLEKLIRDESGAASIEYALIASLISVAGVTAITSIGTSISVVLNTVSSAIDSVLSP